jgi:Tol biopolymer transport system component
MESRDAENCTNSKQRLRRRAVRGEPTRGLVRAGLIAAGCLHLAFLAGPAVATELVSVNLLKVSGDGSSSGVAMSSNGNSVAFYSDANDLVPGDTNQARDVFVRDSNTGTTERVSVTNSGAQANGPSQIHGLAPALSANGQIVAFYSDAKNLGPEECIGGTNEGKPCSSDSDCPGRPNAPPPTCGTTNVFVRDRQAHTTTLVSVNLNGTSGNRPSLFPSISADGSLVAFQSAASDLVSSDTNSATDIFVRDLQAGKTDRIGDTICPVVQGREPNASSFSPSISGDGRFVAFVSAATNLDPQNAVPGLLNIFVCDRTTNKIKSVSVSSAGVPGNGDSMAPAISSDGSFVAFKSESNNLVDNDTNGVVDVFVRDTVANKTERISVSFTGGNSNDISFPPSISDDGRFVAFGSAATNLVPNDGNGVPDMFVRDRLNGVTLLVDLSPDGQPANGGVPDVPAAISGDGTQIGFVSFATNLVPNDQNLLSDVFASENPFLCPAQTCPQGLMCVNGFCVQPTPTPTMTSKTPLPTPTPTPTSPTPTPTVTATPTLTPTPIHCIGTEDCPVGQVCVEGLCLFPTATPTPQACSSDSDCTPPLVCRCPASDPLCAPTQKFCQPAVSPTPTVTPTPIPTCSTESDCTKSCSTADDCRATQDCVSGDCSPADRCVDGVCAPTRLCSPADTSACVIDRETCLNNTCVCGGDCDGDGFVWANEIATMIQILSGGLPVSDCEAGDMNQDGEITGHEICNAEQNLGNGCPLGYQDAVAMAAANPEPRTLTLTGPTGPVSQGQPIQIDINLTGTEGVSDVATAQLDVLFDTRVLSLDPDNGCTVPSNANVFSYTFMPRRPGTPDYVERLRLFVADLDACNANFTPVTNPFGAGLLLTCGFIVNPTAPLGQSTVSGDRTNIGDILGNMAQQTCTQNTDCPTGLVCGTSGACEPTIDITVVQQQCQVQTDCSNGLCRDGICQPECPPLGTPCPDGTVCRTGACVPECTKDADCTGGLVCRDSFCTPTCTQNSDCPNGYGLVCVDGACVPPCTTNFDCPGGSVCVDGGCQSGQKCVSHTDCPVPLRQACVNSVCVCGGDCDGNGYVTGNEIELMVSIFGGAPLASCPAGDIDGNTFIDGREIEAAVQNFAGCP